MLLADVGEKFQPIGIDGREMHQQEARPAIGGGAAEMSQGPTGGALDLAAKSAVAQMIRQRNAGRRGAIDDQDGNWIGTRTFHDVRRSWRERLGQEKWWGFPAYAAADLWPTAASSVARSPYCQGVPSIHHRRMPQLRRQVLVIVVLAIATGALLVTGSLWRYGWSLFDPLSKPWQTGHRSEAEPEPMVALRERVQRLNVENVILRRRLNEYGEILGSGRIPLLQRIIARGMITARTQRQGRRFCEIDVGAVDGVHLEDPVMLGWTLVGRVRGIGPGRALVQMVTDAESRIPAALFDNTTCLAEGVLRGLGEGDTVSLDLIEDRPGLVVREGQQVVTSGLSGLPTGLVLGTVVKASRGEGEDHWQISVALTRDPTTVESVVVIRPDPEAGVTGQMHAR